MSDLTEKIESCNFECEAGPLTMSRDWKNLKAEIERLGTTGEEVNIKLEGQKALLKASHDEIERLTTEVTELRDSNAKLGKLSESLMLYEDEYYDEAKQLLAEITTPSGSQAINHTACETHCCPACGRTYDHDCADNERLIAALRYIDDEAHDLNAAEECAREALAAVEDKG